MKDKSKDKEKKGSPNATTSGENATSPEAEVNQMTKEKEEKAEMEAETGAETGAETANRPKLNFGEKIANIFAPYAQNKQELSDITEKKKTLEDEKKKLEEKVNGLEGEKSALQSSKNALEQAIQVLKTSKEELNSQIAKWESATSLLPDASHLNGLQLICVPRMSDSQSLREYAVALKGAINGLISKIEGLEQEKRDLQTRLDTPTPIATQLQALTEGQRIDLVKPFILDMLRNYGVEIVMDSVPATIQKLKNAKPDINLNEYVLKTKYDELLDECNAKVNPNDNEKIEPIIVEILSKDLNKVINEPGKEIRATISYDNLVNVIAECLLRPESIDDALTEGQQKVLDALSQALNRDVDEINDIETALGKWHRGKVKTELLPQFNVSRAQPDMEIETIAKLSNAAISIKSKIDALLDKYGIKDIDKLPSSIREAAYAKVLTEMTESENSQYQLTKEMREALAKSSSLQSAIVQLVKYAKSKASQADSAAEARDEAIEEKDKIALGVIEAVDQILIEQEIENHVTDPVVAVSQAGSKLNKLINDAKTTIEQKDAKIKEDQITIEANAAIVAKKDALIDKVFGNALKQLDKLIGEIEASIKGICVAGGREKPVAKAIDERIMVNDFYGFAEFKEQLEKNLAEVQDKDFDEVHKVLQQTFDECLKIPSATWIDNLARLYLYSQVPFIAQQFMNARVNIDKIAIAFGLLESMLKEVGIELSYPALFVDTFDPGIHESETIKNITGMVSDIASHVDDDETIVDLFTVGYTLEGVKKENPVVSRLNK